MSTVELADGVLLCLQDVAAEDRNIVAGTCVTRWVAPHTLQTQPKAASCDVVWTPRRGSKHEPAAADGLSNVGPTLCIALVSTSTLKLGHGAHVRFWVLAVGAVSQCFLRCAHAPERSRRLHERFVDRCQADGVLVCAQDPVVVAAKDSFPDILLVAPAVQRQRRQH